MAQKTGALIFDETADRYDIRFDLNSVPYYSVSKWSSNTKMLLLHFHAP